MPLDRFHLAWQNAVGTVEKVSAGNCTVIFDDGERVPNRRMSLCVEGLEPSFGNRCIVFFATLGLRDAPRMFTWDRGIPHELTVIRCSA